MDLEDLVLRIPKGSPLTPLEMDENLDALRDAINGQTALFGVALNPDGSLKTPQIVYGASTTGSDAYAITPVPAVASLASLIGRLVIVIPNASNAGAATLNVSGLGAHPITKFGVEPLTGREIKQDRPFVCSWDGVSFCLISLPGIVQPANYVADTGAVDQYVAQQTGAVEVPDALYVGYRISVKITSGQNTGACNLIIKRNDGTIVQTVPIKKNVATTPTAGDLKVGGIYDFQFDGTNFQIVSAAGGKKYARLYHTAGVGVARPVRVDGILTTVDLTTSNNPDGIISSIAAGVFTLKAGTYFIDATVLFGQCYGRIFLINATTSALITQGVNCYAGNGTSQNAILQDRITLTADTLLRIQYFTTNVSGDWAAVSVMNQSTFNEIWADVFILEA